MVSEVSDTNSVNIGPGGGAVLQDRQEKGKSWGALWTIGGVMRGDCGFDYCNYYNFSSRQ